MSKHVVTLSHCYGHKKNYDNFFLKYAMDKHPLISQKLVLCISAILNYIYYIICDNLPQQQPDIYDT